MSKKTSKQSMTEAKFRLDSGTAHIYVLLPGYRPISGESERMIASRVWW